MPAKQTNKVFISTSSFGKDDSHPLELLKNKGYDVALNPHKRTLTDEELADWFKDGSFLIAGTEKLNKETLQKLPRLKVISRCGVGLDNIDLEYCKQKNILVRNTPRGPTDAVAELTIGLIFSLLRTIPKFDREIRGQLWEKNMGTLLKEKTLGFIGMGNIAKRIVNLLEPFDLKLLALDPKPDKDFGKKYNIQYTELDTLLSTSDIVSLHLPYSADVQDLIDAQKLKLMKKTAYLLNTSRGGIVSEAALYQVLKEKQIAGAALDVFGIEPYQGVLRELDNIILTPHIGSYAREARIAQEMASVTNLLEEIGRTGAL